MTAADLLAWRQRLGLTQKSAAAALGCAQRSLSSYETGQSPIPRYIALAAKQVEEASGKKKSE
jgi:transcriptional regulator with XRE-family HTH domain